MSKYSPVLAPRTIITMIQGSEGVSGPSLCGCGLQPLPSSESLWRHPHLVQPVQVHLLPHGDVAQCQDLREGPEGKSQASHAAQVPASSPDTLLPGLSRPGSSSQLTHKPFSCPALLSSAQAWPPPRLFQVPPGSFSSRVFPSRAHWALLHLGCLIHVLGVQDPGF